MKRQEYNSCRFICMVQGRGDNSEKCITIVKQDSLIFLEMRKSRYING
ncbi:hypothetical protein GYO_2290 [Bacillus spizizenii TU-B-10]|uniref:Uncharacterized protein n=1 Tax=Bacillus spizizenii (strain DSM 15029 / JCM 12233 / NBRC 101239 / NRRL B-23049 / TU-B-10) TaxID=1052585 RepID=G4NPY8_BACS4|nr:hypothetical protein GYO_2290 [Bacillus spizizenii TU-B-10]